MAQEVEQRGQTTSPPVAQMSASWSQSTWPQPAATLACSLQKAPPQTLHVCTQAGQHSTPHAAQSTPVSAKLPQWLQMRAQSRHQARPCASTA
jgi:hypothetical protein